MRWNSTRYSRAHAPSTVATVARRGFVRERQQSNIRPADEEETTDVAQEVLAAIPEGAYPSLARVAMEYSTEPYDDAAAFDFGLDLILDGLQRLLE